MHPATSSRPRAVMLQALCIALTGCTRGSQTDPASSDGLGTGGTSGASSAGVASEVSTFGMSSSGPASAGADGTTTAATTSADSATTGASPDVGTACVGCGMCTSPDRPTAFEQTLLDLPPQSWYAAPDSHMREVCPTAPPAFGNCSNVVAAWSTGAYDPNRRRMMVWGGGHADYSGNELYGFDLRSGTWSRLTEPSPLPEGVTIGEFFNRDPLPDGQPVTRHSYDGVEFLPDLDLLWAHGGSRGADGNGTNVTWLYDDTRGWLEQPTRAVGAYTLATAYDQASRRVFVYASEDLHIYSVDDDTWTNVPGFGYSSSGLWPRYAFTLDKTGVIDPTRRLFWVVGGTYRRSPNEPPFASGHGNVMVWDMDAGEAVTDEWVTVGGGEFSNVDWLESYPDQHFESGGGDIYNVMAPGIDYDSATDSFVAWPNWGPPYILDLQTKVWSVGPAEGAPPNRTASNSGGTYGRWRYLDAYNVFILVDSVDDNVYFHKHTAGCGPATD